MRAKRATNTTQDRLAAPILADTEIDQESKAELLKSIVDQGHKATSSINEDYISLGKAAAINKNFAAAKLGVDPIYKTRRLFQNRRESVLSQPGRGQTVLTR